MKGVFLVKIKKIASLFFAAVIAAAMASPAFAESYDTSNIGGQTEFKFSKYLVFNKDVKSLPNDLEITFDVTPGDAVAEKDIQAGISHSFAPVKITISNDDLASAQEYNAETLTNTAISNMTDNQKYVKKEVSINFTGVAFPAPGNYIYNITETKNSEEYITNDPDSEKQLVVVVQNDTDLGANKLKIVGYYLSTSLTDSIKTDGFTNSYVTNSLTFSNSVLGNQANLGLYFKYTVTLTNCVDGEYTVNLGNATSGLINDTEQAGIKGSTNPTSIHVDSKTGTANFYLKNSQSIVIENLPKGAKYSIKQDEIEGYTVNPEAKEHSGTIGDAAASATFQNTKNGTVPTGVILVVAPFAALTLVGGVGAFAIARKKKKDEDED